MKMRIAGLENDIEFTDSSNTVLCIKDNKLFGRVVYCLSAITNGHMFSNEVIVLDNQDKDITKNVKLIVDPMSINSNERSLLKKLYAVIESNILDDGQEYEKFKDNIGMINTIICNSLSEINLEFEYNDNISITDYLKTINVKISSDSNNSIYDCLFNCFELASELGTKSPFIICNCLSYLDEYEILELCKY